MTRFVELDENFNVVSERNIDQSAMLACPHALMVPEHYRIDQSCRCDDPTHTSMRAWGYVWSETERRWT